MKQTMGQIIRRLRKERNLTQEELAEQLGVTFQAVSKWENDSGMPDISQVVPLANVFGVSTDMLFGLTSSDDGDEVKKIINDAQKNLSYPLTKEALLRKYRALREALRTYPNNMKLLMECLETGVALSYPENEVYDADNGRTICDECIRFAGRVISHSPNTSDILRARMIMVILHSAYGNFSEAYSQASKFPHRADYNIHVMYAYYAHWKKDYDTEVKSCQYGAVHYLEGLLNIAVRMAKSYALVGSYTAAAETLETTVGMIDGIFTSDEIKPPLHHRENGDIYVMIAEYRLKAGDIEGSLDWLERAVDYRFGEYQRIDKNTVTHSPLLDSRSRDIYGRFIDRRHDPDITAECFGALKSEARYEALLRRCTNG